MIRIMLFPRTRLRRLTISVGGTLLSLAAAWFVLMANQEIGPRLDRDNVRQIKAGMTQLEVETLVGAHPSFSAKGPETAIRSSRWANPQVRWDTAKGWIKDDSELTVFFDEEGRVVDCRYFLPPENRLPLLDRLTNQVKYQWRMFWL